MRFDLKKKIIETLTENVDDDGIDKRQTHFLLQNTFQQKQQQQQKQIAGNTRTILHTI